MEFSLYIHWPFCIKKCPYCDFNSYAWKYQEKEWVNALIKEIQIYKKFFPMHKLKTVFFGGGTPSLISPNLIKQILDQVFLTWPTREDIEITLETNPSSIETHKLEEFIKNGINRFSIGVQSLNDEDLKFLGRLHSAQEAKEIVKHASKICKNISADFIYTLPHDYLSKWKKQLCGILEFAYQNDIKHLSLYQLTIEDNTRFSHDVRSNKWIPMNQDNQSILYRYTHKIFNQINWNQYEISNSSKTKEFESQHNLTYWRYNQYLGVGPGAHSRMIFNNQKYRFNNYKMPLKWQNLLNEPIHTFQTIPFLEECIALSEKDQTIEKLLMGFRLKEGVYISNKEMHFLDLNNLNLLIKKNFIKQEKDVFSLSLNGKLKLNPILKLLIKDQSP